MEGETTGNVAKREPSQGRRFAGFPRSAGQAFSHNPKVAGSNPAPATNETLWYPTFQGVSSRPELPWDGFGPHLVRIGTKNGTHAVASPVAANTASRASDTLERSSG